MIWELTGLLKQLLDGEWHDEVNIRSRPEVFIECVEEGLINMVNREVQITQKGREFYHMFSILR